MPDLWLLNEIFVKILVQRLFGIIAYVDDKAPGTEMDGHAVLHIYLFLCAVNAIMKLYMTSEDIQDVVLTFFEVEEVELFADHWFLIIILIFD